MLTKLLILASVLLIPSQMLAAEASMPPAEPVPFEAHDGYFVSNKFEPTEPTSFVVLQDQESFEKVFGIGMVMRDKSHRLAPNAFDKKLVVAAIHRGKAMVTYQVERVVSAAGTLVITYNTKSEPSATAEFSCPLILSLEKGNFNTVRYVENSKEIKALTLPSIPGGKNAALLPVNSAEGTTLYSIKSPSIGQATIACNPQLKSQEIHLRFYLGGLESLTLDNGQVQWKASVLSHSGHPTLLHLWQNGKEGPPLTKESPDWVEIHRLDADGKPVTGLPPAGGYFELIIPQSLLKNTQKLALSWIDFYR